MIYKKLTLVCVLHSAAARVFSSTSSESSSRRGVQVESFLSLPILFPMVRKSIVSQLSGDGESHTEMQVAISSHAPPPKI